MYQPSDTQQYQISNLPSRYQLAQHFHSSLDEPNLDNVQAKLYAIRQKNYQMAQQFFQQKYGSSIAYDQYLENSNMTDLKPPHSPFDQQQEQFDLKHHLAHKALEIQHQELQKINGTKGQGKVVNKRANSSKKNPWLQNNNNQQNRSSKPAYMKGNQQMGNLMREKSQVRSNRYDEAMDIFSNNYRQQEQEDQDLSIEVVNLKRNKEEEKKGQFMSEFKQYLVNKKRLQSAPRQVQQQSPTKSKHLNNSMNNNSLIKSQNINQSQLHTKNKSLLTNSNSSNFFNPTQNNSLTTPSPSPQQELVKKIFKSIHSKHEKKHHSNAQQNYVQKIQLAEYLTTNQRILDVLKIGAQEVLQKLHHQFSTKDPNKVMFHECLMLVYHLLGKENQQKKLFAQHSFSDTPSGCMLKPQVIKLFEKTFRLLDKPCDLIVKRLDFIERLAMDPMLSKILNTPAVFEPNLNKTVSLRRVFERIQVQTLLCPEQETKAKQYISWAEFMRYFESGHTDRGGYDMLRLVQSLKSQQKMGFGDIPQAVYEVICQVISKLDKGEEYFNTHQLIGEILLNKIFEVEKYSFVRGKGNDPKSGNIPMETFQQTLMRIKETGPKFVSVKQFLEFFSVRGRPIEAIQQEIQDKIKAANEPAKVATVEEQIFGQQSHEIDGYDSDPQFYNHSALMDKKQFRRTFVDAKNNLSNLRGSQGPTQSIDINLKNDIKITVPKPFKFEERQKQRQEEKAKSRMNRSASFSERQKSGFKFRAKQIPQKVKQKGLYQQMLEEDRKRIQDRKKCSMLLNLANQQPFSFYNRNAPKKTKQERQEFQFKANPIPWFCSVDLLKKKEEQQVYRNEKIARMAQESLNKAKLPPRMEKDFQEKLARKNLESTKKNERPQSVIKTKEPPNFELLHKQFEAGMQRKRKQNKTTQIKQFNFREIKREKKPPTGEEFEQENMGQTLQGKQQKWRQTLKSSINVFASSTAKFDQQVQKRRKQMQEKKRKQKEKKKEEDERNKLNDGLNKQLQQRIKSKKEIPKDSQQLEQKRKEMKDQEQNFKVRKAEWLANAAKQPLLVERPLKRDLQIQKMKKLFQISQNLKKNGIKGKEHDQYFKRDELLLLKDYQFLLQKGEKI